MYKLIGTLPVTQLFCTVSSMQRSRRHAILRYQTAHLKATSAGAVVHPQSEVEGGARARKPLLSV